MPDDTTILIKKAILVFFLVSCALFGPTVVSHASAAASLYMGSSTSQVYPGGTFTVYPRVNTGGAATNAYQAEISYTSNIQAIGISKGGSICSLYTTEPSYTLSTASISCGLPTPGYNGTSGSLGSITFRALTVGTATVSYAGGSKVLANDGSGTNILGSVSGANISIVTPPPPPIEAPAVSCTPGGDNEWVSSQSITCTWNTPSGASGFSFIITQDQNENPGSGSISSETSASFSNLSDGVYYFKIKATGNNQWSTVTTYTIKIDTTPPEEVDIVTDPDASEEIDVLPMVSFNAIDAMSGVVRYEIRIDNGDWIEAASPYMVPSISSGNHTVAVKAIDAAGNQRITELPITVAEIPAPIITKPKNGAYLPIGEYLIVEGTTTPDSTVYIYLDGKLIAEVTSDRDGNFTYTHKQLLLAGKHELYATSKGEGGIVSKRSEVVRFSIDIYAVKIGPYIVPSFCAGSFILTILVLLVLLAVLLIKRYSAYRKRVHENVNKSQDMIDQEFDQLKDDLRDDVEDMLSDKTLNKDSHKLEHKLEQELDSELKETEVNVEDIVEKIPPETQKDEQTHAKEPAADPEELEKILK